MLLKQKRLSKSNYADTPSTMANSRNPTQCQTPHNFDSASRSFKLKQHLNSFLNRSNLSAIDECSPKNNLPQKECRALTRRIINNGQKVYINVLGDTDDQVVRAVSQFPNKKIKSVHEASFTAEQLSPEERIMAEYISQEIAGGENRQKMVDLLKYKVFRINNNLTASYNMPDKESQTKPPTIIEDEYHQHNQLPYLMERQHLKVKGTTRSSIKIKRGNGFITNQQIRVGEQFLELNKRLMSKSVKMDSKQYNLQKYDMSYDEYKRKGSGRQIDKDYNDKLKQKQTNVVRQFQDYIMKEIHIGERNRNFIAKGFKQIIDKTQRV